MKKLRRRITGLRENGKISKFIRSKKKGLTTIEYIGLIAIVGLVLKLGFSFDWSVVFNKIVTGFMKLIDGVVSLW